MSFGEFRGAPFESMLVGMRPALMAKLLWLFRCNHEFGWPRRRNDREFYQVCLLCGAEYDYDWAAMRRSPTRARGYVRPAAERAPRYRSWQPRERRLRWTGEVTFRRAGTTRWERGTVENVSRSGVFFRCESSPLNSGESLEMILEMPPEISGHAGRRVLCQGEVARCLPAVDGGPGALIAAGIAEYKFLRGAAVFPAGQRASHSLE